MALLISLPLTAAIAVVALCGPQEPRDTHRPAPAGTGVISGRVLASDTGTPMRGARVVLLYSASDAPATPPLVIQTQPPSTSTDDTGRFEFTGLSAGRYRVVASQGLFRAHYLPTGSGGSDPPAPIDLDAGARIDDADVVLLRAAAISGRVHDEAGDSLARVFVSLLAADTGERVGPMGVVQTDDLGQFRLFGLAPGEYVIAAEGPPASPRSTEAIGFVTTYSSATTSAADATRISVGPGGEAVANVVMVRARLASLSGQVVSARGEAAGGASIQLTRRGGFGLPQGVPIHLDPNGRFIARGLPPGEYRLSARSQLLALSPREMAAMTVRVDGTDVEDLSLVLLSGAEVTGTIDFDGTPPPDMRVQITATSTEMFAGAAQESRSSAAGLNSFTLHDLWGPMLVRASVQGAHGWTMKAVMLGGRDITDVPTELTARDGAQLQVLLSARAAALSGTVLGAAGGSETGGYIVAIFGEDPSTWIPGSSMWRTAPVGNDGAFRITGLRDGHYFAVALPSPGQWGMPQPSGERLRALSKDATRVTLGAGEHRNVELHLVAGAGRR